MSDNLATNFYVEFQTVVQRIGDDTLAEDVAAWARKAVLDDIREWYKSWPPSETPIDKAIRGSFKRGIDAYAKERAGDS